MPGAAKICPRCQREYEAHFRFCLDDGSVLVVPAAESAPRFDSTLISAPMVGRVTPAPVGEVSAPAEPTPDDRVGSVEPTTPARADWERGPGRITPPPMPFGALSAPPESPSVETDLSDSDLDIRQLRRGFWGRRAWMTAIAAAAAAVGTIVVFRLEVVDRVEKSSQPVEVRAQTALDAGAPSKSLASAVPTRPVSHGADAAVVAPRVSSSSAGSVVSRGPDASVPAHIAPPPKAVTQVPAPPAKAMKEPRSVEAEKRAPAPVAAPSKPPEPASVQLRPAPSPRLRPPAPEHETATPPKPRVAERKAVPRPKRPPARRKPSRAEDRTIDPFAE